MNPPHRTPSAGRRHLLQLLAASAGGWSMTGLHAAWAQAGGTGRGADTAPGQLRIGITTALAINLSIVRQRGTLEKRLPPTQVRWSEFSNEAALLEALAAGALDFGMAGTTTAAFTPSANAQPLVYAGVEPPQPDSAAILVRWRSTVRSVEGLKGRRVAMEKGSGAHYLVLRALDNAGLAWGDIEPVYLAPAAARTAFESGTVDAWSIQDPFYAAAEVASGPRVLATARGLWQNRSFYLASRIFAARHPLAIAALVDEITQADRFAHERRLDTLRLLADGSGLAEAAIDRMLRRRPHSPVAAPSPEALAEQQHVADSFHALGLIPQPLRIPGGAWAPDGLPSATVAAVRP